MAANFASDLDEAIFNASVGACDCARVILSGDCGGDNALVDLIRCILGNPFRPVVVDSGWFTPTVIHLGLAIYQERLFDHLPILADALEDAGCTNADILQHCRGPGPHVRGCWAVDLLLERQ